MSCRLLTWLLDRVRYSTPAREGSLDIKTYLVGIGAVVDEPDAADLTLDPAFEDRLWARIEAFPGERTDREALAWLIGVRLDALAFERYGESLVAHIDEEWIGQWESRSAFVADMAASRTLADWASEEWTSLSLTERSEVLGALRLFLERCPTCDGEVVVECDVVDSSWGGDEILTMTCTACDDRLLEIGL